MERGLARDLAESQGLIGAGDVLINERVCDKAGYAVSPASCLRIKKSRPFVSRGGEKLDAALRHFTLVPRAWCCADIGCSTGGFTDCLLRHGAGKVYAVDVGYGILDWKLRQDARVVVLERTNARFLGPEHIREPLDFVVIDASFISLKPLLSPLLHFFYGPVRILALVKPQFQLSKDKVGTGGIVRDAALRQEALDMVEGFGQDLGLQCEGIYASPVHGAKGNQEFFMLFSSASAGNLEKTERIA